MFILLIRNADVRNNPWPTHFIGKQFGPRVFKLLKIVLAVCLLYDDLLLSKLNYIRPCLSVWSKSGCLENGILWYKVVWKKSGPYSIAQSKLDNKSLTINTRSLDYFTSFCQNGHINPKFIMGEKVYILCQLAFLPSFIWLDVLTQLKPILATFLIVLDNWFKHCRMFCPPFWG